MRDHRIAVGVSLEGKIREHGFFLAQIIAMSRAIEQKHLRIEQKHLRKEYPINLEVGLVKDICAALARNGTIERTSGAGNRKPKDSDIINLKRPPPPKL
jgi:hypothetical protein